MMLEAIISLLILLQIKHWYIDFVKQTSEEIYSKGIYGDLPGIWHSVKHGIGTLFAILILTGENFYTEALLLALLDMIIHYHVDWIKSNINKRRNYTSEMSEFWWWFGFDQFIHQLTYLLILYLVFV